MGIEGIPPEVRRAQLTGNTEALKAMARKGGRAAAQKRQQERPANEQLEDLRRITQHQQALEDPNNKGKYEDPEQWDKP